MNDNFDRCLAFVLKWEGGYVCDKHDPGGETKYGISKRSHPDLDIKCLSMVEAKQIYFNEYWIPSGCDKHVWPMDLIMFDTAVNMGQKRALILFQENIDWRDFLLGRINFYLSITHKTKDRFLKGWINRVLGLYSEIRRKF